MTRKKLTTTLLCLTVIGSSAALTPPAHAADLPQRSLPCAETFSPPYDYPCSVADAAIVFVLDQAGNVVPFVQAVIDDADETADAVYQTVSCTINPDDPDCS